MNQAVGTVAMEDVHDQLLLRVNASSCLCGRPKEGSEPFCWICVGKLDRVDFRFRWWIRNATRAGDVIASLWLYDICADLLADPLLGEWKPAKKKKELDA